MIIQIKYGRGRYGCRKTAAGRIYLSARPGQTVHETVIENEEEARKWLCDRGLRKSKAKQLLAAGVRSEGPFADPNHPRRLDLAAK